RTAERAALNVLTEVVGAAVTDLSDASGHPLFARIVEAWADEPTEAARVGVARDVALIHVASMSNLFAALGWALADPPEHPSYAESVAAGDRELAESCALESTRLAQRSLMARYALEPITLETSAGPLAVGAGTTVATLLPLTNTSAAVGLDEWQPE